jgi:ferredoxin
MRVHVDADRCQGHTLCNMVAPELFKLAEDDGHAYVDGDVVPARLEEAARRAVQGCPEQAITVSD